MFYTGASSWLKTPLLGICTSRRQRMMQIHSASQICWKCWEEWIIVPANRKHHLASLSWKKVCMKIPYCKLWLLWQDAMLIPMAELEQICAERNPEVTKSGERYWVYLIDRELNPLLQFGKEMSMHRWLLRRRRCEHSTFAFFWPTGGQRWAAAETNRTCQNRCAV